MQKTLIVVLTAGACIGLAATLAATYRPSGDQITGFAQSLADGVILGAGSWPHGLTPVPPELQATLLPRSLDCNANRQCDVLALSGFVRLPNDAADTE
jgi:ethanolamine ammonia-lyase large subunit